MFLNEEVLIRLISSILAPVVMVSGAAILLNGFLSRYSLISASIRALNQERLTHLQKLIALAENTLSHSSTEERLLRERLNQINEQSPALVKRHNTLHQALYILNIAIIGLIVDMFLIAGAVLEHTTLIFEWIALVCFLVSLAVLLRGIYLATMELRYSQREVEKETQKGLDLSKICGYS